MTDGDTTDDAGTTERTTTDDAGTMDAVDHTHPHTGEPFGAAFRRGPDVAADGGERGDETTDATPSGADASDGAAGGETMADVDHERPTDGVDRAFERGTEGRTDAV